MSLDVRWVAADLLTGQILADLADIEWHDPLPVVMAQAESAQLNLHVAGKDAATVRAMLAATTPAKSVLIAYLGDDLSQIVWGGIIVQRVRDLSGVVQLSTTSLEGYLDACYVGNYNTTGASQNLGTVAVNLLTYAAGANRLTWSVVTDTSISASAKVSFTDDSMTTVLSALQSLSGLTSGPEWLCDWVWFSTDNTIRPRFTVSAHIGTASANPAVWLESGDMLPDGTSFSEDWTTGQGANTVTVYGSPPANVVTSGVPLATATDASLGGRPLWAYRWQPTNTTSDGATLAQWAAQGLGVLKTGGQVLACEMPNDLKTKQVGVDWFIGDDVGYYLTGPSFPDPVSGVARIIGYQITAATITPIIQGAQLA